MEQCQERPGVGLVASRGMCGRASAINKHLGSLAPRAPKRYVYMYIHTYIYVYIYIYAHVYVYILPTLGSNCSLQTSWNPWVVVTCSLLGILGCS